jgi:uncharacterized membrane protein
MAKKNKIEKQKKRISGIWYILIYFFEILGGIVGFIFSGGDKSIKFHSLQAILLAISLAIITFILGIFSGALAGCVAFLVWLYSLYIGYQAGNGVDIELPVIGSLARQYSK